MQPIGRTHFLSLRNVALSPKDGTAVTPFFSGTSPGLAGFRKTATFHVTMISSFRSSLLLALLGSHLISAQEPPSGEILKMIDDLASDSYQERQQATVDLWDAGSDALLPLREASRSDDPEKSLRAAELLAKIELRITPDTPESVLKIIRDFQNAPDDQKSNFLNELKRNKAYFQVLKLYSMEERADVREELVGTIRGVAISGARESIATGDQDTAIELLKMSGTTTDLMALACLYRSMGRLDSELGIISPPENVPADLWKITLLRAKGDLEGAIEVATGAKYPELLAGLKVLTGDPTMWISQNGFGESSQQAHPTYVKIALKRWVGEEITDEDFAPLLNTLEDAESDDRQHASALHSPLWEDSAKWQSFRQARTKILDLPIIFPKKKSRKHLKPSV